MTDFLHDLESSLKKELKEEVSFLRDDGDPSEVKYFVSTGSTVLDYIISNRRNGGIPVGKITEISGLEGTGKSLIAMQICAETIKLGGTAIFVDTEHAFNPEFAQRVGLQESSKFRIIRPSSVEGVFEILFKVIHSLDEKKKSGETDIPFVVFVWDSVAQTPCKDDITSESTDPTSTVGLKPRILSKNIATLIGSTARKNVASVFLNQLRTNIRAMPGQDKYITPGGKAIPFAATIRIQLRNAGKIKSGESIVGINVKAKCVKTRLGPPYRECTFPLYFTHGVDEWESIIDALVAGDAVIERKAGRKGAQYHFKGDPQEGEMTRLKFKNYLKNEEKAQARALDLLCKVMIVDLFDPENSKIEIVSDDSVEIL